MEFKRQQYLQKLIAKMNNGKVKVITGIRRCGKSYLLFGLFARYLHENGVADDQIITLALDEVLSAKYRNPMNLDKFIREQITDKKKQYYIFIDEIQFVEEIRNPYIDNKDANRCYSRMDENQECRRVCNRKQLEDAFQRCVDTVPRPRG